MHNYLFMYVMWFSSEPPISILLAFLNVAINFDKLFINYKSNVLYWYGIDRRGYKCVFRSVISSSKFCLQIIQQSVQNSFYLWLKKASGQWVGIHYRKIDQKNTSYNVVIQETFNYLHVCVFIIVVLPIIINTEFDTFGYR